MKTFKASEIKVGSHPGGFRIDKTAAPMEMYTRWDIREGVWKKPRPVCFDSLPQDGWHKLDKKTER